MRVLILVGDQRMGACIVRLLRSTRGIASVSVATSCQDALERLSKYSVDLLMASEVGLGDSASTLIADARPRFPDVRMLVALCGDVEGGAVRAATCGADGYLAGQPDLAELAAGIHSIQEGYQYFVRGAMARLLTHLRSATTPAGKGIITERTPFDAVSDGAMLALGADEQGAESLASLLRWHHSTERVAATSTRSQALALLQNGLIRLVVVDERLQDCSGLDFVAEAFSRFPRIPVILIGARSVPRAAARAALAGAACYLEVTVHGFATRERRPEKPSTRNGLQLTH